MKKSFEKEFLKSLSPSELKIIQKANKIYDRFLDAKIAQEKYKDWQSGNKKSYTLDEARKMILS